MCGNHEFLPDRRGYNTAVGDEGGFAPSLKSNVEAIEVILEAIDKAGYKPGAQVAIALDPAASEFYKNGTYELKAEGQKKSSEDMVAFYANWCSKYPIFSIEDGLAEDDWRGWKKLTERLGRTTQLVYAEPGESGGAGCSDCSGAGRGQSSDKPIAVVGYPGEEATLGNNSIERAFSFYRGDEGRPLEHLGREERIREAPGRGAEATHEEHALAGPARQVRYVGVPSQRLERAHGGGPRQPLCHLPERHPGRGARGRETHECGGGHRAPVTQWRFVETALEGPGHQRVLTEAWKVPRAF